MAEARFKSSLSEEEIEKNFKDIDLFPDLKAALEEALAYEEGTPKAGTFVRKRSLPDVNVIETRDNIKGSWAVLEYRGYVGSIEFSKADEVLFGKLQGIRSLVSYEGKTVKELLDDFRKAVDNYLKICSEKETSPEKPTCPPVK